MKKLTAAVIVSLLAGAFAYANCGFCGIGKKDKEAGKVNEATVNTSGLAALIAAKVPMVIIDARSGKYDDGKRIPGAKSLNAGSTDEEIKALLPDKSALIITYCANLECPASHQLAEKLMKAGYVNLIEYPEGIEGWQKAGHKVEKVK
ncbi:MAG: rhodanese-like domain-containing protein [Kiritimatiellia bacterium]